MQNVSVRLEPETIEQVEEEAEEQGVKRAVYLRELIENRHESEEVHSEYEQRVEELERENDRLNREKRQILDQRTENTELRTFAQEQRELVRRKHNASLATRLRWFVFGGDDE